MTRFGKVLLALVCVLLCGSVAVWAQGDVTGPLQLTLKLEAETTDNRDSAPDGFEEDNTDFFITPRLEALYDWDRTLLDFFYEPTLRYRTDAGRTQNDTQFYHDLSLHLRHELTPRLSVMGRGEYDYTDDPSVEEGGTTLRRDSSFAVLRLTGGGSVDLDRQTRATLTGSYRDKSYEETAFEVLDEDSFHVTFNLLRRLSRTLILVGEAKFNQYNYDSDDIVVSLVPGALTFDRGNTVTAVGGGIESQFAENCRGTLRVGVLQQEFDDDTIDSETAPYVNGRLILSSVPSTRLNASVTHTRRDSDVFPFAAQQYTDLSAGVEVDTTERVTLEFSGTYRLSEYKTEDLPSAARALLASSAVFAGEGATGADGDETVLIGEAGVALTLSDDMLLKVKVRVEDEDSDISTSYARNSARVSLIKSF
jgi:hypothetical protein